jgi:TonB family protein
MKTIFAACIVLVCSSTALHAQDTIAAARDLYTSANYEEALAVLGRMDSPATPQSDRLAINQYRAFCLLALGRTAEAERAIEAIVAADLLYHPANADVSPRLRSAFAGVRRRILPTIVVQEYTSAKAAYDRGDHAAAVLAFERVLRALGDPDIAAAAGQPPLADLRTLANGFRELSAKALAPPPAPPAPAPAPAAPITKAIYASGDADVVPPVILRQALPSFPREILARGGGVLEVVIDEAGDVQSASMLRAIDPRYDAQVITAARAWKYVPASVNGTPVKFRKLINISVKPGS